MESCYAYGVNTIELFFDLKVSSVGPSSTELSGDPNEDRWLTRWKTCRWNRSDRLILAVVAFVICVAFFQSTFTSRKNQSGRAGEVERSKDFSLGFLDESLVRTDSIALKINFCSEMSCYYRPEDANLPPSSIPENLCTHIIVGFATVGSDYRIEIADLGGADKLKR